MIWYEDLFVGESITPRKKKRIIRSVRRRSPFGGAYILTLATNPDNLIDIILAKELHQRAYPCRKLFVIGLAGDYEEALRLAGGIVSGIYTVQGDFNVRAFFGRHAHRRREDGIPC